jgi:hypothetical protein
MTDRPANNNITPEAVAQIIELAAVEAERRETQLQNCLLANERLQVELAQVHADNMRLCREQGILEARTEWADKQLEQMFAYDRMQNVASAILCLASYLAFGLQVAAYFAMYSVLLLLVVGALIFIGTVLLISSILCMCSVRQSYFSRKNK